MRATILAGIYGACAIAVLTFYAVYQWLDPFVPLVIGVIGIAIPCVLIVMALEEDARPPSPNVMLLAEAALVAGIFGVALPGMWSVSDMRLKALSNFPSDRSLEAALDDEHDNVRDTACRMMFDPRFEYDLQRATATLYERPELAVPCLRTVPQVESANEVTRKLAVMWHQGLLGGTAEQCVDVAALDNLMIAEANRAAMLLDCSLQAESAEVRKCCTDRVAVSYPGRKLLEQLKLSRDNIKQMGTSGLLVAASFGEDVFLSEVGSAPDQFKLQSDPYRRFSAETACSAVSDGTDLDDAERYMRWVFSEHEECITPDYADGITDVHAACDVFLDDDREDLGDALCHANLAVRKQSKEAAAKVRAGVDLGDFAENIDAGRNHLRSNMLSTENYGELIKSDDYKNLTPTDRKILADSFARDQRRKRREETDQPSKREARQQAKSAETAEGRQKMSEEYVEKLKGMSDVERATGISAQEFLEGTGDDGELSEELQQKLDELEQESE